jgi:hypothetical protein
LGIKPIKLKLRWKNIYYTPTLMMSAVTLSVLGSSNVKVVRFGGGLIKPQMVIVIHYAEVTMKEFTKNELRRLARIERDNGNFPLANFLERAGEGKTSIVVINKGTPLVVGLPQDIHMIYIDDEYIQEADTGDDEYIKTMLSIFGKEVDENTTWGDARNALYEAVKEWGNPTPTLPTPEDSKHIYGVSITIPGWDYRAIQKAIKKKTYVQGISRTKSYGQEIELANGDIAEVRFFPPCPPVDQFGWKQDIHFTWRIMADGGAWLFGVNDLGPTEFGTPAGIFVCQLEPDPTYE